MRRTGFGVVVAIGLGLGWLAAGGAAAFPIDAGDFSGIGRLKSYQRVQNAKHGPKLPPGALLSIDELTLSLRENQDLSLEGLEPHPALQQALEETFRKRSPSYSVAVLDITDPAHPAYAGLREYRGQLPGSVGKLGVLVAFFDGLRRAFPDLGERERILTQRVVVATDWAVGDSHTAPVYDPGSNRNVHRPIRKGDRFRLSEWIDHMVSASANSAASTVWKEAMLLRHFGDAYPPSPEAEAAFFQKTPKKELTALSLRIIEEPLQAVGVRPEGFRQGTMFTWYGRTVVPGVASSATPRELLRILLRLEQGRLVDEWSSLWMKRFLYLTKRRYRYCYAPELSKAAVYFKSGSVYSCSKAPGARCGQFMGDRGNLMNSVAIVESPAEKGPGQRRYLVALMSNVLNTNSAWEHSRIAAAIEKMIQTRQPVEVEVEADARIIQDAGKGEDVAPGPEGAPSEDE